MKYHKAIVPILVASILASQSGTIQVAAQNEGEVVTISPFNASSFNGGRFEGWGTSFCWWANRIGYSDSLSKQAATAFYDKDKGLGLNIVRYNIGGGDDPSHTHITRTDSAVPGYAVNPSYDAETGEYTWEYDWSADANQRNVLMKAMEACGDEIIVEAFSNSPPYFMTNSGCSSGAVNSAKNNLKDDAYEEFAEYLADVSEHFKTDWNVDFQSITAMNEPYTSYWGANSWKQEGCHFDQGESMDKIILELRNALDEKGLQNIQISGTDETSIDTQISSYNKLSTETKNTITRIDTHTYGGSNRAGLKALAESEGKNLWMSEVDGGDTAGTNAGEMGSALWLAERIISDMNGMTPSAWILWQVIDNHICEAGYNGNKDTGMVDTSAGFWGTAVADHDKDEIVLTMKYYGFGQFSRYIRPGYTIIASDAHTLAAYDQDGKQLVIVATNTTAKEKSYEFDLSQFSKVGDSVEVIRTSGDMATGEKWAELSPISTEGKGFKTDLKANSITTFIVKDVENDGNTMEEIELNASMVTGTESWGNHADTSAQKVVDGNKETFFDGLSEGYVQIDLGDYYQVDAIAYAPRQGYAYRCVGAEFFGSLDGKNWNNLYSITTEPSSDYNYIFASKYNAPGTVRYIKYAVPGGQPHYPGHGDDSYSCNIAEIKLFGTQVTKLTALANLCEEYGKITQGNYTEESYAALKAAIENGNTLVKNHAGETEAQEAINALSEAVAGLVFSDKTPQSIAETFPIKVTKQGNVPELPETVSVITKAGEKIQADITWDYDTEDFNEAYATVSVTGTVKDTDLKTTIKVEVIPEGLLYFINCGTIDSESDVYDAVAKTVELKNDKSDQKYDGSNGWGISGTYTAYTGNRDADKFQVGYYGENKSTDPIIYTLPLEEGTYHITVQNHEWWSGPRTMSITATWTNANGEEITEFVAENVKVSNGDRDALNTASITLDCATDVVLKTFLVAGTEAPAMTFVGVAKETTQSGAVVERGSGDLIVPEEILNKAGTSFTAQLRTGSLEENLKMVEAVLAIDKNLEVTNVSVDEDFMGGSLNWNVEEGENANILRLIYADLMQNTTLTTTQEMPYDLIHIEFSLKDKLEKDAKVTVTFKEFEQLITSEEKADYLKEEITKEIKVIEPKVISISAKELYTGDGSDLIPQGEKAVKLVFTGLEEEPGQIHFIYKDAKINIYQSADFTKRDGIETYVMTVPENVTLEELKNVENYEFMTRNAEVERIVFGDTNNDEVIDAQDALNQVRTWLRKNEFETNAKNILTYNVTGDGAINSADALATVENFISGKNFGILKEN